MSEPHAKWIRFLMATKYRKGDSFMPKKNMEAKFFFMRRGLEPLGKRMIEPKLYMVISLLEEKKFRPHIIFLLL